MTPKTHTRIISMSLLIVLFFSAFIVSCFFTDAPSRYLNIQTPEDSRVIKSSVTFSRESLDSSSLKVLIWNVYKGKRKEWSKDFRDLAKERDLILVQEAFLNDNMKEAIALDGLGWNFATSFIFGEPGVPTGVLTISEAKPVWKRHIGTKYREPVAQTPKVSLATMYGLTRSEKKLLVVNTHAINFVGMDAFESQMNDLESLMNGHPGPIIFAGDLNTWSEKRNRLILDMISRLELKSMKFQPDYRTKTLGHRLDHIFYRGLVAKSKEVLEETDSSDHKPMTAEFALGSYRDKAGI